MSANVLLANTTQHRRGPGRPRKTPVQNTTQYGGRGLSGEDGSMGNPVSTLMGRVDNYNNDDRGTRGNYGMSIDDENVKGHSDAEGVDGMLGIEAHVHQSPALIQDQDLPLKRKRGRPPKYPKASPIQAVESGTDIEGNETGFRDTIPARSDEDILKNGPGASDQDATIMIATSNAIELLGRTSAPIKRRPGRPPKYANKAAFATPKVIFGTTTESTNDDHQEAASEGLGSAKRGRGRPPGSGKKRRGRKPTGAADARLINEAAEFVEQHLQQAGIEMTDVQDLTSLKRQGGSTDEPDMPEFGRGNEEDGSVLHTWIEEGHDGSEHRLWRRSRFSSWQGELLGTENIVNGGMMEVVQEGPELSKHAAKKLKLYLPNSVPLQTGGTIDSSPASEFDRVEDQLSMTTTESPVASPSAYPSRHSHQAKNGILSRMAGMGGVSFMCFTPGRSKILTYGTSPARFEGSDFEQATLQDESL
ncbi:hypothetical protein MMC25_003147 [Agyrium rufum]|nr:hypothetical protein [Agyrium rufum]